MTDIFKIEQLPSIYTAVDDATNLASKIGVFDKMYHFTESWTADQEFMLRKWLSYNCIQNFIFSRHEIKILAGGSSDNIVAWEQRTDDDYHNLTVSEYFVKLYNDDVTAFELVWLTDFV